MAALLALISSLLWGAADFFGGLLTKRLPALLVVAVSQGAACLVLLPYVLVTGAWHSDLGYLPYALVWGVTGPLGLAAFYYALSIGTMGVVSPISAMGIVVPVVVGLAQGERPNVWQIVAIVVAIVGVVLVAGPDVHTDADESRQHGWRPVVFAVIAALGFGSSYVFVAAGAQYSLAMTLFSQRAVSALVAAALVLLFVGWTRPSRRDLVSMVGVGTGDVAANAFYGLSSTLGLLSVTAVFGSLFPVATTILAWFLLHEQLTRLQKLGVALAMVGVVGLAGAGA
jgi:drug/metabolite transporter (DMT)-like permease